VLGILIAGALVVGAGVRRGERRPPRSNGFRRWVTVDVTFLKQVVRPDIPGGLDTHSVVDGYALGRSSDCGMSREGSGAAVEGARRRTPPQATVDSVADRDQQPQVVVKGVAGVPERVFE
jgi:hypothetical protein